MQSIKECFDSWSETITRLHPSWDSAVVGNATTLKRLGLAEGKGCRALDIGCGSAVWAAAAAESGYESYGLDLSEKMIDLAEQQAANVRLICDDFMTWQPDQDGYDLVIAAGNQITYYEDHRAFLDRALSLLRPGGTLLIACADFRPTLRVGRSASILAHVRHQDESETVVVDYRRVVDGKKADSRFWVMTDDGRQWSYDYPAHLHTLKEIRDAVADLGFEPSGAKSFAETGYAYPIITVRS